MLCNLITSLFIILISVPFASAEVSYDHVLNTNSQYSINYNSADKKFENAILLEESILNNFSPADVKVLKKSINGTDFNFYVEKRILGFTKKFEIIGNINIERRSTGCLTDESAYYGYFDFSQSGPTVTDAVAALGLLVCAKTINENSLQIRTVNSMFYRGKKYGAFTEPIAKSILNDQVNAFFNAVKLTLSSL